MAATSVTLPFAPRPAQEVIFDLLKKYRFVTAVCHRRLGKTRGAVAWLCLEGLTHKNYELPYRGYYFAPTKEQARTVCWHFFKQMLYPLHEKGLVGFHETSLSITLPNGGMIYLKSGEPDSIETTRGIYAHRAVLDELATWKNAHVAFNEVIRPALMDTQGRALFIGTVKGLDLLYEFFNRGSDERFSKKWASLMFKASETGILSQEEIDDYILENEGDPAAVARELECDFFAESSDMMIPAKYVQPAIGNIVPIERYRDYSIKIGIDPGITSDPSSVCVRQGPKVHTFEQFREDDHEILATKLIPIIQDWRPAAVYVDSGRGEQLIKQLNKKLEKISSQYASIVHPVVFNSKSPAASCYNFRTYMYWEARRWFAEGEKSIPNNKLFIQEVTNQLLEDTENTGSILRLAPKKKIRNILNRSPDHSDAFAVTFADGIESKVKIDEYRIEQLRAELRAAGYNPRNEGTYDPINHLKKAYMQMRQS